jgi:hypothetical protein
MLFSSPSVVKEDDEIKDCRERGLKHAGER